MKQDEIYGDRYIDYGEEHKKRRRNDDSNGYEPLTRDYLKRLLEPLNKEQLVSLLMDAGSQYPPVAACIKDVASKDPAHRKLFVRGLAWETTSQALRDAFEQYGEIEEGAVITDKQSGKSRGFGFITFKDMDAAQLALKEPSKTIDGRITVCNLASAGTSTTSGIVDQAQRKLYIGGLSYDTSNETLLSIFSQYGEIEEGAVAYDKNTNKSRGFAFITFKTVEAARKAIDDPNKTIEGRHVVVKLAAEGQKEKALSQTTTQGQGAQVQGPYSMINPNIPAYPRPAPFAPYGMPPYPGQAPYYPGVYNPAQYAAAAAATAAQYGMPNAAQPGPGAAGNGAGGYYASAS